MKRAETLASVDRKKFVRDSFAQNDKTRQAADTANIWGFILVCVAVGLVFIGGINSYKIYSEIDYTITYTLALASSIALSIACFLRAPGLRRTADSLDYQLMAAFPDWQDLLKEACDEDQK
jgi:hypothetical protein|nr:MAG TPA: hypothetical protein [Caudoviricetes sp.]